MRIRLLSRLGLLALGLVSVLLTDIITPVRADMPTPDRLMRQFGQLAFSSEIGGQYRAGRLIKWERPIRARVYGENVRAYMPEVEAHLRDLRHLTGLKITVLKDLTTRSNLDISILSAAEMRRITPYGLCYAEVFTGEPPDEFSVTKAKVYIIRDNPIMRRHCLVEELSQSLGLTNDSTLFKTSIFNDYTFLTRLAPWDEQMIYMLYDPRLQPGMTLDQALPTMRSIVNGFAARNPF